MHVILLIAIHNVVFNSQVYIMCYELYEIKIILEYYCFFIFHNYFLDVQILVKWLCKGVDNSELNVLMCKPFIGGSSDTGMIFVQHAFYLS